MIANGPKINSDDEEPVNGLPLLRKRVAIMVVDMVESVRLIAQSEASVVAKWMRFTKAVRTDTLPKFHGTFVKSLGDGLMATFEDPRQALRAAEEMHLILDQMQRESIQGDSTIERVTVRIGLHCGEVVTDEIDIFGHSANVAARITTIGGPDEIVISSFLRDEISVGLDAELEDLGPRYFKHLNESIGIYRVLRQAAPSFSVPREDYESPLYPTLAVIPFESISASSDHISIGDLLSDAVIGHLGQTKSVKVVSRLSTKAFRNRNSSLSEIASKLGANFVLSGSYAVLGSGKKGKLVISAELASTTSSQVVWSDRLVGTISDLLAFESELCRNLARECYRAIFESESNKVWCQPFDTLAAYSLNLSGVKLLHASTPRDFNRSVEIFQALNERHSRFSEPYCWLGKWYVLRVIRGLSSDPRKDAQLALDACNRALDLNPNHSTAQALKGYTLCQVFADQEGSKFALDRAVEIMPSEIHAWLGKSLWEQHWGDAGSAVDYAKKAQSISPLDPQGSFLESILANAYSFNHQYALGIETAKKCLKLDRNHAPAIRGMLLSQVEMGLLDEAKVTAKNLLRVTPDLTLKSYQSMGNMESKARQRVYAAMLAVGIK
jgi:adenylate cyclase